MGGPHVTDPHPEKPPFRRHPRYYLLLKIAVLIIAVLLAIRFVSPFFAA